MVLRRLLVAWMAAGCSLAAPVHASTIRVPADQPTLQQGLDAAAAGDTVLVAPGTYTGPDNQDLDFRGKDLVFRSEAGPEATIIDCTGFDNHRGVHLQSGETAAAIIDGFLITHGHVTGDEGDEGAGLRCDSASPTIRNCIISNNSSDWIGGGIALVNSTATLTNCVITDNTAAAYSGGVDCYESSITLTNCVISNNEAGGDFGAGGGISAGGSLTAIDCTISNNAVFSSGDDQFTQAYGGGMAAGGDIHLIRCTFEGNLASAANDDSYVGNQARGGGAVLSGNVVLNACIFRNNTALSSSGPGSFAGNYAQGGGLDCQGAVMNDCVFAGNTARSEGNPDGNYANGGAVAAAGAVLVNCVLEDNSAIAGAEPPVVQEGEGGGVAADGSMYLIGCTLVGNSATTSGAAVQIRTGGVATIENSILAFSPAGEAVGCTDGGATPYLSCSDVYGNAGGDWAGCIAAQAGRNGNFSADPRFCDLANGNYRLYADSPCAPWHAPGDCGLVGAQPVQCGQIGIAAAEAPAPAPAIRIVPNPVRPDGVVLWTNTNAGTRRLKLYDPLGRLVISRELGFRVAGDHEIQWRDVVGDQSLRAGIYFLTLEPKAALDHAVRVIVMR